MQSARTERIEALEMVAVYMAEKACKGFGLLFNFSKVVDLYKVSDAGMKAFETNFE